MAAIRSAEAVVIGGGVIGAASAYYLAREGAEVMLLEAGSVASGASGAADGLLSLQAMQLGAHLELGARSMELYPELAADLGLGGHFRPCGGLLLARDEGRMRELAARAEKLNEAGLKVEVLAPAELRKRLPEAGEDIRGATYCAADAWVNPRELTLGLLRRAKEMGARVLEGCQVENIMVANNRVREVQTTAGRIRSRRVICAAGTGSNRIGKMIIVDIPVLPQRGQVLVVEGGGEGPEPIVAAAEYLGAKSGLEALMPEGEEARKLGLACTAGRDAGGDILLGSTHEFVGFDGGTTPDGLEAIARSAAGFLPLTEGRRVVRSFGGLRPCSPDGLPILGRVKGIKGFFIATGHAGDGICLAPVTGKLVCELLRRGETGLDIEPFSLHRFK